MLIIPIESLKQSGAFQIDDAETLAEYLKIVPKNYVFQYTGETTDTYTNGYYYFS